MMAAAEVAAPHHRDLSTALKNSWKLWKNLVPPAGEDALGMMQLLNSNSDGSLSSEEFEIFQKQVEFMRKLEDKDNQFKALLNEKLQMTEDSGLIQVYSPELGNRLAS